MGAGGFSGADGGFTTGPALGCWSEAWSALLHALPMARHAACLTETAEQRAQSLPQSDDNLHRTRELVRGRVSEGSTKWVCKRRLQRLYLPLNPPIPNAMTHNER